MQDGRRADRRRGPPRLRTAPPLRAAPAPPPQEVELEREMKILEEGPLGKLSDATATADKPTN